MIDESNRLHLTPKDIELIEAALHTQKKILAVQSKAGGAAARRRLSDIKHLMQRVSRSSRRETCPKPSIWSRAASLFVNTQTDCTRCPTSERI